MVHSNYNNVYLIPMKTNIRVTNSIQIVNFVFKYSLILVKYDYLSLAVHVKLIVSLSESV